MQDHDHDPHVAPTWPRRRRVWPWIVGVLAAGLAAYLWFGGSDGTTAWVMCENFIEARSSAPSIAFDEQDADIVEAGPDRWVVGSRVDQGNGLRDYRCEVTHEGDKWTLVDLNVDRVP